VVNLTLRREFLRDLETRGDPTAEAIFAFSLCNWDGYLDPQGALAPQGPTDLGDFSQVCYGAFAIPEDGRH
jgi:hypothetical protein